MALHGCMRCMKYLVFSFNFFVWLCGMAVLGFAIWLRMDPQVSNYIRAAYDKELRDYYTVCYVLMAAGGVMTFVGFLGCCGAFQESKCMLALFFVFLFLIFSAEITGGVWAFIYRKSIRDSGMDKFRSNIQNTYGTRTILDTSIDYVQISLKCCGASGPGDWKGTVWSQKDIFHASRVPDSCCKDQPVELNDSLGQCGKGGVWQDDTHTAVNNVGCGEKLVSYLQHHMMLMVTTALVIISVQFFGLIFSITLCCAMRRSRGGGYKS